jgi:glycosyltransferase involved in cell wall biosynthesis
MSQLPSESSAAGPVVSVVVPAFEAEATLAEALASIHNQGMGSAVEIIVVDDGSSDRTAAVAAADPDVHLIRQPNAGPAAARNRGIAAARGDFLTFLDADDHWEPGRLPLLVQRLHDHAEIDMVQGLIQRQRQKTSPAGEITIQPEFAPYNFINLGAGVYRRQLFERVGGFDESLGDAEDTDWILRAWEAGARKLVTPEVFLHYRVHDASITLGGTRNRLSVVKILHRHLSRLRVQSSLPGVVQTSRSDLDAFLGAQPRLEPLA